MTDHARPALARFDPGDADPLARRDCAFRLAALTPAACVVKPTNPCPSHES